MHHFYKIKRVPFVIWYSKHEITHLLIGLVFAWILREVWGVFSFYYVFLAAVGSLVIDVDHLLSFFTYGRKDWYAQEVRRILRQGQIGTLLRFWRDNHKHNTGLASHNVYVLAGFLVLAAVSTQFDWKASVIFFGAIFLHLVFDMFDDYWALGHLNDNWKHLRRNKAAPPVVSEIK